MTFWLKPCFIVCPMLLTLEEIFEEFADLDRQDQSLYLLELGDGLPELPADAQDG